jgi:hypothetical protein
MARSERHLVVDGSNIATEGRTFPSLAQLDEAVRAIVEERAFETVTVIVDATFAHRIDASEREEFEAAVLAGEVTTPPAGAIGRGDAFILQVADKIDAVVLSNDSFQEFHGEHVWLFEEGRLVGGKPIGGVGWVFVERAPVRGPASRRSVRQAEGRTPGKRGSRSTKSSRSQRSTAKDDGSSADGSTGSRAADPRERKKKTQGSSGSRRVEELNDARAFMRFVSRYSIGDEVEGVVERYSSHGCYLRAATARCYLPSRAMGDPPPTRARDVVSRGQTVVVRVDSLDADRRGINVALVSVIEDEGAGTEGAGAEPELANTPEEPSEGTAQQMESGADDSGREPNLTRSTTTVATKKPAKKTTAARKATKASTRKRTTARTAATKKAATATVSARAARASSKRAGRKAPVGTDAPSPAASSISSPPETTAKKTTAKKPAAKKTTTKKPAAKKATAKKTTAKKGSSKKGSSKRSVQDGVTSAMAAGPQGSTNGSGATPPAGRGTS